MQRAFNGKSDLANVSLMACTHCGLDGEKRP